MNFRKAVLFVRDESDPLAKLGSYLVVLGAAGVVSLLVAMLSLLAAIGGEDGQLAMRILLFGFALQLVPFLLAFVPAAGYLTSVARRVAAGEDVVLLHWRETPWSTYLRRGLVTTLPLVAWLAVLVTLSVRTFITLVGGLGDVSWQQVAVDALLVVATVALPILWIPPTIRYVMTDWFVVYFSKRTWTFMVRPPYLSIWAHTAAYCGLLLLGGMVGSGLALTIFGLLLGPFARLASLLVYAFVALAVAHLIGQAAHAVYDYEQRDRQADSAESTPHPA